MRSKDINWSNYYATIHGVCPFSGYAYREGKLLHTQYKSWDNVIQNESMLTPMKLWAVAYLDCPFSVEELDSWVEERNSQQTLIQYYFSHPEHNPNGRATPIPMLIQQRRDILDMARKGVFTVGMDSFGNPDKMVERYETTGQVSGGTIGKGNKQPRSQETRDKIRQTLLEKNRAKRNINE